MNIMHVIGSTLYINYIENANSSREAKERKGQRLQRTRCVPLTFYDNSQTCADSENFQIGGVLRNDYVCRGGRGVRVRRSDAFFI